MRLHRASLLRAALSAFVLLAVSGAPASAQFFGNGGYGGFGYGGFGYGGLGYGFGGFGAGTTNLGGSPMLGYSGFGGVGGGFGYGGGGYGGFGGYGGGGYGGYGGGGYGGFGYGGFGPPYAAYSNAFGLGGVGYPGISALNPYFSFGLSPLAVENAAFERTVLGRGLPPVRSAATTQALAPAAPRAQNPVGMGTFSPPR
jgi:hypothetical protein